MRLHRGDWKNGGEVTKKRLVLGLTALLNQHIVFTKRKRREEIGKKSREPPSFSLTPSLRVQIHLCPNHRLCKLKNQLHYLIKHIYRIFAPP